MIFHYFKNALRVFLRNSGWLFINLFGLSVGIAASLLILLYIANEISFDRFHKEEKNIWRVLLKTDQRESHQISSCMPAAIGVSLKEEYPEIISFTRVSWPESGYVNTKNQTFHLDKVSYADSSFFKIFSFKILHGNINSILSEPDQIVLTKTEALKIFGHENPLGRTVRFGSRQTMTISGIMDDFPENSHLQFDAIISFSTLYKDSTRFLDWNGGNQYMTYILTGEKFNPVKFQEKLLPFLERHINYIYRPLGVMLTLDFEPLNGIHLKSIADADAGEQGNLETIMIFGLLAIFILFISIFNFTNLATAMAMKRAKETGIRKVSGAGRLNLIVQYLSESLMLSFLALGLSILIIEIIIPYYSALVGYEITVWRRDLWWIFPISLVLVILTGLIAGAYPSFFLASFEPMRVLKGGFVSGKGKRSFSSALVIMQFFISIGLLNCAWVLLRQLNYISNYDLGFRSKNVLVVNLPDQYSATNYQVIENEFAKIPGVISCGAISEIPGGGVTQNGYFPERLKQPMMINVLDVDENAIPVLGLEIVKGRNFEKGSAADQNGIIVNEAFVRQLGWHDPIGKKVFRDGELKIIGVVKDFHFATLHDKIVPLILNRTPFGGFNYLIVHVNDETRMQVKASIEQRWRKIFPDQPYIDFFISSFLSSNYTRENLMSKVFVWFTAIAVILAFMGLLGLSAYSVQQRRKEIGIRKIYGASVSMVLRLLTGQYIMLTIIASMFAIPVSWIIMNKWMANFSYHAGIPFWIFLITTLLALIISLVSIGYQSVKASLTNPAEVIQYE